MSITGDADLDAQLNALLYHDDIEYVKQGLEIADSLGVDVLDKAVGEMIAGGVIKVDDVDIGNRVEQRNWFIFLFELQKQQDKPFKFWKKFKYLDLSFNDIEDYLPYFKNLTNLDSLILDDCYLEEFPQNFKFLKKLKGLSLARNEISEIPEWIDTFKKLEYFDLASNDIYDLPDSITKLKKLKWISLKGNPIATSTKTMNQLRIEMPYLDIWY